MQFPRPSRKTSAWNRDWWMFFEAHMFFIELFLKTRRSPFAQHCRKSLAKFPILSAKNPNTKKGTVRKKFFLELPSKYVENSFEEPNESFSRHLFRKCFCSTYENNNKFVNFARKLFHPKFSSGYVVCSIISRAQKTSRMIRKLSLEFKKYSNINIFQKCT